MVKETVNFIGEFEQAVSHAVKQRDEDGVICGHIHAATIKDADGITYVNCGDWVDSCTAVIEDADGHMQLIEWGVVPRHAGRNASGETWSGVRPTVSAAPRSPNC
jgi:UDP-2,3-diacylglucosamine pyrophosphatase LpxH